jgi:hypothetical protein
MVNLKGMGVLKGHEDGIKRHGEGIMKALKRHAEGIVKAS